MSRKPYAATGLFQERLPAYGLKVSQGSADRWLRKVQHLGRTGNAFPARNLHENLEMP
ncbi:hypothetical protein KIN_02920 [Litoreibacter roseus]|uniref:Uncharacterized protein n=1 Tax=Litoreibacter roseus TaxID=2601869 RepID=A0A6N6JD22_9RHOB|nr:hypothetical protein KIN_02920 [Litoreibacter roseus]